VAPAVIESASSASVLLPIAIPIAAGVVLGLGIYGLHKWLSARQERSQRQAQEAEGLTTHLKELEKEANKRLRQQQQEFQTALIQAEQLQEQALQREAVRLESQLRDGLREQRSEYLKITQQQRQEYTKLIQEQERKFTALIEAERQEREQGQKALQQQIDKVQQDRQQQAEFAQNLLADVEKIWSSIDREYQHQRFAPGQLARLQRDLQMARTNTQAGMNQAAIAITQQTYLALSDLRLQLEQKEQEWLVTYNSTLKNVGLLISEAQAHQQSEVVVGEGAEAERFPVDVDYWTHGSLSQYQQELKQIETRLTEGESTLSLEQVKEINETIVKMEPRLSEIIEQAKRAISGSQIRVEIADQVVNAFESLGYSVENFEEDAAYEGDDQRAAYMVKVKNEAGDEVVTVIAPQQEFGVNSVSINTFPKTFVDENVTRQNAEAIFTALKEEGIEGISPLQCNENAKPEYQDIPTAKSRLTSTTSISQTSSP
ncbi:MAG: hypothetical protein SAK29_08455, partial [Scytonema sp. PMC 1069.18]|nr:hypothetical protein [Scytonema sp. PMC 1069.18]